MIVMGAKTNGHLVRVVSIKASYVAIQNASNTSPQNNHPPIHTMARTRGAKIAPDTSRFIRSLDRKDIRQICFLRHQSGDHAPETPQWRLPDRLWKNPATRSG